MDICFVAHNAYGALAGKDTGHTGGIERQQSLMARWLAGRGHRVSMITWDEGQGDTVVIDSIRVISLCGRDAGFKGVRFIYPKWTALNRALKRADAELYYYNCGDMGLGQVVWWCRRHGRRCVYSVASEPDCNPLLPVLKPLRERMLYRYGLTRVDRIVAQTKRQHQMLRDGFGVGSAVLPMPCPGPGPAEFGVASLRSPDAPRVVWVGRFSKQKRLNWLLDVAERCPQVMFDVVGAANTDSPHAAALARRAEGIPNVALHGRVAYDEVPAFYRRAQCLCCTSRFEGFPNTFLEAWSHGLPVISTFDPDGLIASRDLGVVISDVAEMAAAIRQLLGSQDQWQRISRNARQYYLDNHTIDVTMSQFEHLLAIVQADGAAGQENTG